MKHNVPSTQTPYQKLSGGPFKILILLAVLLASSVGSSMATSNGPTNFTPPPSITLNVPAEYATIQEAVNNIAIGGIITVAPGTYNENVKITKSLTLISSGGAGSTTIQGANIAQFTATIHMNPNVNDVTIGGVGKGFTIIGYDSPTSASERAAIYFQGAHNNITIRGNDIVANGEAGILTQSKQAVNNLTIEGNTFSGKTFVGNEAGCGGSQFVVPNYPRPLVYIGTGSNILFSNNNITGTAGGPSSVPGECESNGSGRTLVTFLYDGVEASNGVTICGNNFAGTTYGGGSSLYVAGTASSIKNNVFNSAGLMGSRTVHLIIDGNALSGADPSTIAGVASMNTFISEGHYVAGGNQIFKNIGQAATQGDPIAANSGVIANASCATCLNTTPPTVGTASGDTRYTEGQTSATVCQNSGDVTFTVSGCDGGTINWTGGNGGTGNIIASSANVGTVTYSATCTINECTSEATTVSVTVIAPPAKPNTPTGNSVCDNDGNQVQNVNVNQSCPTGTSPVWYIGGTPQAQVPNSSVKADNPNKGRLTNSQAVGTTSYTYACKDDQTNCESSQSDAKSITVSPQLAGQLA